MQKKKKNTPYETLDFDNRKEKRHEEYKLLLFHLIFVKQLQ